MQRLGLKLLKEGEEGWKSLVNSTRADPERDKKIPCDLKDDQANVDET